MQQENLVERIAREVMRQLNSKATADLSPRRVPKILALFTGGTIGLAPGLAALGELRSRPTDIGVVLSPAAENVIGAARIKEALGPDIPLLTTRDPYPGKMLRETDVVVVPVLTQNTAAKLARAFSDTVVTTLVLQALMLGKPVLVAVNAADPHDGWRVSAGMGRAPAGLARMLQDNLKKIEGLGVRLVDVRQLAGETGRFFERNLTRQPAAAAAATKVLIDAAAVKAAQINGSRRLDVPRGAVVTPLAVDAARDLGVELVREQAEHS
ncbi:MAG: flavoprotein [Negativicutes bacterium]|nr:flavoprotein [Negativicutes bacterium]